MAVFWQFFAGFLKMHENFSWFLGFLRLGGRLFPWRGASGGAAAGLSAMKPEHFRPQAGASGSLESRCPLKKNRLQLFFPPSPRAARSVCIYYEGCSPFIRHKARSHYPPQGRRGGGRRAAGRREPAKGRPPALRPFSGGGRRQQASKKKPSNHMPSGIFADFLNNTLYYGHAQARRRGDFKKNGAV